jgi:hypothetical protein
MKNLFISKERKVSTLSGTGIQYITGHVEPLIDLVINNYLPESGNILDLAGGGLRFGIPVAMSKRKITVVDLDPSGVNIPVIFSKLKKNKYSDLPDLKTLKKYIKVKIDDVIHYLNNSNEKYSLITSFRLIHFFKEDNVSEFFRLISNQLSDDGLLIISAITPFIEDNKTPNELFINSSPVFNNIYYRKFIDSSLSRKIRNEQNLGEFIHFFTKDYLASYLNRYDLEIIKSELP